MRSSKWRVMVQARQEARRDERLSAWAEAYVSDASAWPMAKANGVSAAAFVMRLKRGVTGAELVRAPRRRRHAWEMICDGAPRRLGQRCKPEQLDRWFTDAEFFEFDREWRGQDYPAIARCRRVN